MPRYVYVLISGEDDNYAAMCLVSATSVRAIDPDAQITILSDVVTQAMLRRRKDPLLDLADEVLVSAPMEAPPYHASRFLKTTMLQRLGSDFIFLDVDTIVVRPIAHRLSELFSMQMALDRCPQYPNPGFPDYLVEHFPNLGWKYPTQHYYNSGVMVVRADDASQRLFEEWHRRWQLYLSYGLPYDQPAFNSSMEAVGVSVGCLPMQYNAVVHVNEAFRRRARVLHFFGTGYELDPNTEYARLLAAARSGQKITPEQIAKAVHRRWPLVGSGSICRQLQVGNFGEAWKIYWNRRAAGLTSSKLF